MKGLQLSGKEHTPPKESLNTRRTAASTDDSEQDGSPVPLRISHLMSFGEDAKQNCASLPALEPDH